MLAHSQHQAGVSALCTAVKIFHEKLGKQILCQLAMAECCHVGTRKALLQNVVNEAEGTLFFPLIIQQH